MCEQIVPTILVGTNPTGSTKLLFGRDLLLLSEHNLSRMKEHRFEHRHILEVLGSPTETVEVRFSRKLLSETLMGDACL